MSAPVYKEIYAVKGIGARSCMIALKSMTSLLGHHPLGIRPYYLSGFVWSATSICTSHHPNYTCLLVCDVEDFETAKAIMEPLLDWRLPTVASCNIRLGQNCNLALYELACKAAAQAMRQSMEDQSFQKPFRFLDLPLELQYQILEYTDLVAPRREITWNPKDGFYLHYGRLFCEDNNCPPEIHSSCQLRNCHQVLDNGCFCRRYHAAFFPICNCWCTSMPLFLVSRSFRAHAQHVFFPKNRFVVMPCGGVYFEAP